MTSAERTVVWIGSSRKDLRTFPREVRRDFGQAWQRRAAGMFLLASGLPHPEQELLKAKLTLQIYRLVKKRGLKQTDAGKLLGIKQPHVSALMRNGAGTFSVERLVDFLTALGQDVEITIKPTRKEHGEVSVVASCSLRPVRQTGFSFHSYLSVPTHFSHGLLRFERWLHRFKGVRELTNSPQLTISVQTTRSASAPQFPSCMNVCCTRTSTNSG